MDAHLRDLKYFVAVADELSFQRAAERLFVSQSLLSKQIRQLEVDLRTQLFERAWREVRLTSAGRTLLVAARQMISLWDEAQRAVASATAEEAAVLTIGLQTSVGRGLLQRAREVFETRRPQWDLRFRHVNWEDATVGLANRQVDVAFLWLPMPNQERFAVREVSREARWVALPASHRLAQCPQIDFKELLDEPFVALPAGAGPLRDFWLALDERGGHPARIGATSVNADAALAAVENGSGVVLLAEGNADLYRRPGVVTRPVLGLAPSTLAIAWRKDDHRGVIADFTQALISVA